jgi:hypothetical protein
MLSRLKIIPENSDRLILNKVYEIKPIDEVFYRNNHFIIENKEIWWEVFQNGISMGLYDRKCFEILE